MHLTDTYLIDKLDEQRQWFKKLFLSNQIKLVGYYITNSEYAKLKRFVQGDNHYHHDMRDMYELCKRVKEDIQKDLWRLLDE